MRLAHPLSSVFLAACTAAALPGWANAQAVPSPVSDPAAAAVALQHQPLRASGGVEMGQTDWHSAHAAVAEFPRGHADILTWEAAQARSAPARGTAPHPNPGAAQEMPHAMHNGMPHGTHQHSAAPRRGGQP